MKKTLVILILLIAFSSRSQNWQWAKTLNVNTDPTGQCHDGNGNLYVCCTFSVGSAPVIIGNYTISASGFHSCIIKFDNNGNVSWLWETTQLIIGKISCDASNNLLFTGSFSGTVTINSITITSWASSGNNVVTGKINASGTLLWLRSGGGTNTCVATAVTSDANGNCFVAGRYAGNSATFGAFSLSATPNTNNYFLIKYDALGNELWLSGSQTGYFLDNDLATDQNGNVFVSGQVSTTVTIGAYSFTSAGATFCLMKYNAAGQIQWQRTGIGSLSSSACVRTHTNGNVYLSGRFTNATLAVGTITLTNNGNTDFFIAGYDNSGNVLWARSGGGTGQEQAWTHALYSAGIYVAVQFSSTAMSIGTLTINQLSTPGLIVQDAMVLARFDYSGNLLSARAYEGGGDDFLGISIYNDCNLYLGGDLYSATCTFTPFIASNPTYSPPINGEVLLVGKMYTEGVSGPTLSLMGNTTVCQGGTATFSLAGANSYTASFLGSGTQTALTGSTFSFNPIANSTFVVSGSTPSLLCLGTTVAPIVINPVPNLTVAVKSNTICEGNSTTFTVSGASTYTWGGGQNTNTLTVSPSNTNTFVVSGSNTLGCAASKAMTIVVSPCTEVAANDLSLAIEIYPNPSSEELNIRLEKEGRYIVTITDVTGQQQFRPVSFDNGKFIKLKVGDLPHGIHLLTIQNGERSGVYKLIIE
jgi:hypothetical protein